MTSINNTIKKFWGLNWLRSLSIHRRLTLTFSVGLVGLLVVITLSWVITTQYHTQREMDDHIHIAQIIAYHVDSHLEQYTHSLLKTAAAIDLSDDDTQPERHALQELYAVGQYPHGVFLLDRRGRVTWTEPYKAEKIGFDLAASLPLVLQVLDGNGSRVSDLTPWVDETPNSILLMVPVFSPDGIVTGVLGGALDPREPTFGTAVSLLPMPVEGEVEVFDSNGLIVSHSSPEYIFKQTEHYPALETFVAAGQPGSVITTIFQEGRKVGKQAIVYAPLENAPWGVEIALPYANVLAPVKTLQIFLSIIVGYILLFTLTSTVVVYQTIVGPLQTLEKTATQLTAGNLDTYIFSHGKDEISSLARSLECMRQDLVGWSRSLEDKVVARTMRITLLHRLGKKLNSSHNLDNLLKNIQDEITTVLPVEAFYIALYDPHSQLVDYCINYDRGTSYPSEKLPLDQDLTGWVITNKAPLLIRDLLEEGENLPPATLWASGDATRSGLSVPLLQDQNVVGVISLQSYTPNAFDEYDLEFLQIIADDVTGAVVTSRLLEETSRRARQLTLVNEIGREMTRLVDAQDLLRETSHHIVDKLGYHSASVYILQGDSLTLTAGYSQPDGWALPGVDVITVGQGVVGHVAQSLHPLLIPDVTDEDRFIPCEGLPDVRAELAVPVFNNARLTGVIDVRSLEVGGLDETDQQMLEAIAGQLAKTLSNGNLFKEVQQQARRAESLNKIISEAATVLAADDLPALLEIVLERTFDALRLKKGVIWVPPHNAIHGISPEAYQHIVPQLNRLYQERDLSALNTVVIEDWQNSSELIPEVFQEGMAACDLRASVIMPLVAGEQRVGGICVATAHPRRWLTEEVSLLETICRQIGLVIDRTHLLDETRQKTKRLQVLNRLGQVISASLDITNVYSFFVEEATKLVSFDRTAVALLDESGKSMEVKALWTRHDPVLRKGMQRPIKGGAMEMLITDPRPFFEGELGEKQTFPETEMLKIEGIHSQLLLPLVVKMKVIGMLTFASYQPQTYSDADLEILQPLAAQLAIAVEKNQLYQGLTQKLLELSAISEVSTALRGAQTLDEMLPVVLDKTRKLMGADAGVIFLVDTQERRFHIVAATGLAEGTMFGKSFSLQGSIVEETLCTGKVDISPDVTADSRYPAEMYAGLHGLLSGAGVPLQAGETAVGMIGLAWEGGHILKDNETNILYSIADMAANAFHRVGLFEQLAERVHEMDLLYSFGQTIVSSLRLEEILDQVCEVAKQAVRAMRSFLFLWNDDEKLLVMSAFPEMPELIGELKYRLGEGLSGWVFLNQQAANVADVAADPRWKREAIESKFTNGGVRNVLIVPLSAGEKMLGVLGVSSKVRARAFSAGDEALLTSLSRQAAVAIARARLYEDVRGFSVATIRSLAAAIDARDPYTHGHSEEVAELAVELARYLGWSEEDLEMLEYAGLLHDVGKIAIPDAVLRKPGKLNDEEWGLIRMHPYQGAQIVKPVAPLKRVVLWIYHHHERWDGKGYPDGLVGEDIPLAARILALADTYNAMTTNRPHRPACNHSKACVEIKRCMGSQFDPQIAQAFLELLDQEAQP